MDLLAAFDRFLGHLRLARGVSEHTLRAYRIDLSGFYALCKEGEGLLIQEVTRRQIRRYLSHLH